MDFRLVRPSDASAFVAGLKRCSERTLYNRFLGTKPRFSDAELQYLTECDPEHHVAIVGFREVNLVSVGRMVRYTHRPDAADFGLIVEDSCQGLGIGRYLMGQLVEAAKEREIKYLGGELFATNSAMFNLVDTLPFFTDWVLQGPTACFEIDLQSPKPR